MSDSPDRTAFEGIQSATIPKAQRQPADIDGASVRARQAATDAQWLGRVLARSALEALATRLPCYAEHKGMLCDRQVNHLGDHVDIYGPLPGHTWPREDVVVKPAEEPV